MVLTLFHVAIFVLCRVAYGTLFPCLVLLFSLKTISSERLCEQQCCFQSVQGSHQSSTQKRVHAFVVGEGTKQWPSSSATHPLFYPPAKDLIWALVEMACLKLVKSVSSLLGAVFPPHHRMHKNWMWQRITGSQPSSRAVSSFALSQPHGLSSWQVPRPQPEIKVPNFTPMPPWLFSFVFKKELVVQRGCPREHRMPSALDATGGGRFEAPLLFPVRQVT